MLTPRFKLSQDENHIYIIVHAPYTNIGETEIDIDGENFLFVSSPYFLRLRLPGRIIENDHSKGSYTCDSGDFHLTFDKETPGEHFENLDMITSLLAPRDIPDMNPHLVEMLEQDGVTVHNSEEEDESDDDGVKFAYGFANKTTVEFGDIGNEFPQIFELKEPARVSIKQRNILRIEHENNKFSTDHYWADYFEKELLEPYLTAVVYWNKPEFNNDIEFTDEEVGILKDLPNKSYLLSKNEYQQVMLGLVDILFAFCYDKRTTYNESTVESSWTINKLSSTLSWFCVFKETKQVLVASYRRALIYPIFRNFMLCKKVHDDLVSMFKKGKKFIIKCVISIFTMFHANTDARYILNQLYIKDYLIFLQKCRSEELDELCNNIANVEILKKDLDLELEELEAAGEIVHREEFVVMENEMALKMASMSLIPGLKKHNLYLDDSEDDSDSSDSSSSDSSDDSSSDLDSDDDPS